MDISVVRDQEYRFLGTSSENGFTIKLGNEATSIVEAEHSYEVKDVKLTTKF